MKPACFGTGYTKESRYCNDLFAYGHSHCYCTDGCKKEMRRQLIWKLYRENVPIVEVTKRINGRWLARLEANVWSTIHSFERKEKLLQASGNVNKEH